MMRDVAVLDVVVLDVVVVAADVNAFRHLCPLRLLLL